MRRFIAIFFTLLVFAVVIGIIMNQRTPFLPSVNEKVITPTVPLKQQENIKEPIMPQKITCPGSPFKCGHDAIPDIAEKAMFSVVSVNTWQVVKQRKAEKMPFFGQSPFGELFKEFFDFDQRPRKIEAQGSGFLIKSPINGELIIVTNNHVVDKANTIQITTHDQQKLTAEVIARDSRTEIALLKLKGNQKFPASAHPLEWGDSSPYRVGQIVLAIGNPFGLCSTATDGIISSKNRDIPNANGNSKVISLLADLIQHSAPINFGNSGGPLLGVRYDTNKKQWIGEVIGINTAIITPSGGNVGIGFAVPSVIAIPVIEALLKTGKMEYGWLGIGITNLPDANKISYNLPIEEEFFKVETVAKDSPADKAGLKKGDIITKVNGRYTQSLSKTISAIKPGAVIELEILQGGRIEGKKIVKVTLGTDEEKEKNEVTPSDIDENKGEDFEDLGIRLSNKDNNEVVVTYVDEERQRDIIGESSRDAMEKGDVIELLNGFPVHTTQEIKELIKQIKAQQKLNMSDDYHMTIVTKDKKTVTFSIPKETPKESTTKQQ